MAIRTLALSVLCVFTLGFAGTVRAQDGAADALVQRLVLDRAAVLVSLERGSAEREQQLLARLAARDREIRAALNEAGAMASETARLESDLAALSQERETLTQRVAAGDSRLEAELAEYRREITSIARSPDPRRRAALARYADGDRAGALAVLTQIQEAETRAVAAGWREIGALANDMRDRGETRAEDVVRVYETAQRLDDSDYWGWIYLARLYATLGRISDIERAARRAEAVAETPRERAFALQEVADAAEGRGDYASAEDFNTESLEITRERVTRNPNSITALRDLGVALSAVSDNRRMRANVAGARAAAVESLEISRRIVRLGSGGSLAREDLVHDLINMADIDAFAGALDQSATWLAEAESVQRENVRANVGDLSVLRLMSLVLDRQAEVARRQGRFAFAAERRTETIAISRQLVEADASDVDFVRDFIVDLTALGDIRRAQGQYAGALEVYREAEQIARAQALSHPESALARRDLVIALLNLGDTSVSEPERVLSSYAEALTLARRHVREAPTEPDARALLASALWRDALGKGGTGRLDEALAAGDECLAIAQELAAADQTTGSPSVLLSDCQIVRGMVFAERRQWAPAREAFQASLAAAQRVAQFSPGDAAFRLDRARGQLARVPQAAQTSK